MITLEEACKIAQAKIEDDFICVRNICTDIGDSWGFGRAWRDAPEEADMSRTCYIINKETGEFKQSNVGMPGQEFFEMWMAAPKIDISKYLTPSDNAIRKARREEYYKESAKRVRHVVDLDEYFSKLE